MGRARLAGFGLVFFGLQRRAPYRYLLDFLVFAARRYVAFLLECVILTWARFPQGFESGREVRFT